MLAINASTVVKPPQMKSWTQSPWNKVDSFSCLRPICATKGSRRPRNGLSLTYQLLVDADLTVLGGVDWRRQHDIIQTVTASNRSSSLTMQSYLDVPLHWTLVSFSIHSSSIIRTLESYRKFLIFQSLSLSTPHTLFYQNGSSRTAHPPRPYQHQGMFQ